MMVKHIPWTAAPPDRAAIERIMRDEGLEPYAWSSPPHDVYSVHEHSYRKVLYVVEGSITFNTPATSGQIPMGPGDRLDLPAGTRHGAVVGPRGVTCLEAKAPKPRNAEG